ncbi:MAG: ClbS/DfsB family four-helix bundle protein [Eubacteriales bacterium]
MSRPQTKPELIDAASGQFSKRWQTMDSMTQQERNVAFCFGAAYDRKEAHWKRDKNLRDVLAHLFEWHQLLLNWVEANERGEAKPFLPAPYTWKTYADMNAAFWQKHQTTPYAETATMLFNSHERVMALIERFSNEALFTRAYFAWTGTTSLGAYCVSATSSHYDWAIKKIKAHIKNHRARQGERPRADSEPPAEAKGGTS